MKQDEEIYDYKYLLKNIKLLGSKYDISKVFNDFLIMGAYSISNSVNYNDDREKEYLRIINSYTKEEQYIFPKMFAGLINSLDNEIFNDVLGKLFEELNLQNKYKGQFFTPEHVCDFMANVTLDKKIIDDSIKDKGYISLNDSACGSSRLIYAAIRIIKKNNVNYHFKVYVEVQDISITCVLMSYIQLSLYGINARVILGNTLTNEIQDVFYTPFAILFPIIPN